MSNKERLIRIEASLTPKEAVLFWLRQECRGKTSGGYVKWMMQRPTSELPRPRIQRQVTGAIEAAMKGQDQDRVRAAARQAQMEADFLILLVNRTNWIILDESRCHWLEI